MQMLHVSNREADKPKLDAQILALSTRLQNRCTPLVFGRPRLTCTHPQTISTTVAMRI